MNLFFWVTREGGRRPAQPGFTAQAGAPNPLQGGPPALWERDVTHYCRAEWDAESDHLPAGGSRTSPVARVGQPRLPAMGARKLQTIGQEPRFDCRQEPRYDCPTAMGAPLRPSR